MVRKTVRSVKGRLFEPPTFDMRGAQKAQPFGHPLDGRVCAQHGRELMGCKSPVGVPTWTRHESKDNHEPTARAIPRGMVWRKPECKRCEATDRNRIQGRGLRGELAHDSKAHRYAAYGKCGACAPIVRVLTWGDLHRERCVSMVQNPDWATPGYQGPSAAASCPPRVEETAATTIEARSATSGNAGRDGAEVSRRRSRRPGVGPLKGWKMETGEVQQGSAGH